MVKKYVNEEEKNHEKLQIQNYNTTTLKVKLKRINKHMQNNEKCKEKNPEFRR